MNKKQLYAAADRLTKGNDDLYDAMAMVIDLLYNKHKPSKRAIDKVLKALIFACPAKQVDDAVKSARRVSKVIGQRGLTV